MCVWIKENYDHHVIFLLIILLMSPKGCDDSVRSNWEGVDCDTFRPAVSLTGGLSKSHNGFYLSTIYLSYLSTLIYWACFSRTYLNTQTLCYTAQNQRSEATSDNFLYLLGIWGLLIHQFRSIYCKEQCKVEYRSTSSFLKISLHFKNKLAWGWANSPV